MAPAVPAHVCASTASLETRRQAAQLAFLASGAELEVGLADRCPLPIDVLAATTGSEPHVVQAFGGGLTARVYRLRAGGRDWTLKLARQPCLVSNVDGQTSFLNEIQRRADFERLKAQPGGRERFVAIVDTTYASLQRGVLLSPWIDGEPVRDWDERRIRQVLEAATTCAAAGLFEWDLCPGNVLDDGQQIRLFDFGYMYGFDPLCQLNSAGQGLDMPLFHPVERFETRNYFAWLLQQELSLGRDAALAAFTLEKRIAIEAYQRLRTDLAKRGAIAEVLALYDGLIARWTRSLATDPAALFLAEGWRSHMLDLDDDLRGQTCTPTTLARTDWLLEALQHHHDALLAHDAFFWHDRGRTRDELIAEYRSRREQAQGFQV
jgi:hypothetical protein